MFFGPFYSLHGGEDMSEKSREDGARVYIEVGKTLVFLERLFLQEGKFFLLEKKKTQFMSQLAVCACGTLNLDVGLNAFHSGLSQTGRDECCYAY
jgi:hypothetical protein